MKEWLRLLAIMADLRDPDSGCPWDCQQTHESLIPHTLEEAYEVADAIESGDTEGLRDELGDLLFQVVFYSRIAEESGAFTIDDVLAAICAKLIRRHPHVFGNAQFSDTAELALAWDAIKAEERRKRSEKTAAEHLDGGALDGVARALPALIRATKLQSRAARAGFEWPSLDLALAKVDEELAELRVELDVSQRDDPTTSRVEHELGDLLLAVSNLARFSGVDPEAALRKANYRFEHRFRHMEAAAGQDGRSFPEMGLNEKLSLWTDAKSAEQSDPTSG